MPNRLSPAPLLSPPSTSPPPPRSFPTCRGRHSTWTLAQWVTYRVSKSTSRCYAPPRTISGVGNLLVPAVGHGTSGKSYLHQERQDIISGSHGAFCPYISISRQFKREMFCRLHHSSTAQVRAPGQAPGCTPKFCPPGILQVGGGAHLGCGACYIRPLSPPCAA